MIAQRRCGRILGLNSKSGKSRIVLYGLTVRTLRLHDPSAAQRGRHRSAAASLYGEFTVALGQEIARFLVGEDVMIEERNEVAGQRVDAADLGAQARVAGGTWSSLICGVR